MTEVSTYPSPVALVARYLEEIYHLGDVAKVREICADPIVRHDPGRRAELSHGEQIARINADLAQWQPHFSADVLAGDAEYAALVWTARGRTAERVLSGIEVFRVTDGRLSEVWNTPYGQEPWQ